MISVCKISTLVVITNTGVEDETYVVDDANDQVLKKHFARGGERIGAFGLCLRHGV